MARKKKVKIKKAKDKKWIQNAIKHPGAFTEWCKKRGYSGVTEACIQEGLRSKNPTIRRRAILARTLKRLAKRRKKRR